jgi:hypothetical protein
MSNEVLILFKKSELEFLWPLAHPPVSRPPAVIPPAAEPFAYAEIRGGAVRHSANDLDDGGTIYESVNVSWPQAKIDDFVADNAANIYAVYGWTQGTGLDNDGTNPGDYATDAQVLLNIMPNHIFAGQKERVFAGEFSLEFSREFF